MTYETIQYDLSDDVATVTLNRPDVMNGLNAQLRVELLHAFKRAADEARVIVTTGAGRGYCSGQDLGDRKTVADVDLERTLRDEYVPLLEAIYDCPLPTIAAVNGPAAGAGANLALAHDVVIAREDAIFIQAFARIGLVPDAGGTFWLPRQNRVCARHGGRTFCRACKWQGRGRYGYDLGSRAGTDLRNSCARPRAETGKRANQDLRSDQAGLAQERRELASGPIVAGSQIARRSR